MPRCSICKTLFKAKYNSLKEKTCGDDCEHEYKVQLALKAAEKFRNDREKERKKESDAVLKGMRERSMTLSEWKKLAQIVFNKYIRLRDEKDSCISCKRQNNVKYNAGHYFSAGAFPGLRYDEENTNKQCEHCNSYLSGNLNGYRKGLIKKIGLERFEALESRCNEVKKYNVDNIKEIIAIYKKKIKELPNEK